MNESQVSLDELISLIYGYFDRRATDLRVESAEDTVKCVLYESFEFECALDAQYHTFGAAIRVGPVLSTTEFFGERGAMGSYPESIRASLAIVERWCRLRLPDKFLEEYDRRVLAP